MGVIGMEESDGMVVVGDGIVGVASSTGSIKGVASGVGGLAFASGAAFSSGVSVDGLDGVGAAVEGEGVVVASAASSVSGGDSFGASLSVASRSWICFIIAVRSASDSVSFFKVACNSAKISSALFTTRACNSG